MTEAMARTRARPEGSTPSAVGAGGTAGLDLAGCRVLRTFVGLEPTPDVLAAIDRGDAAGVTLFRHKNVGSPAQLRDLCARLQDARPAGDPPLIIGLDQEGGQLQAVGDPATAWPGNLALGATGSASFAEAAGRAIGLEAAALGATLVFAPVCDVLQPQSATPLGTRPFGSDPALVGRLAAAMVRGLQDAGVAAVLKHFPGHGSAVGDSHAALPIVHDDATVVRARDLAPFREGIAAGARALMPGHLAVPALTDGKPVAATVSPQVLGGLLRGELGFDGVAISDALDMGGAGTAGRLDAQAVDALAAGMDLLLLVHAPALEDGVVSAIRVALATGALDARAAEAARARIHAIRTWLGSSEQPGLEVVGCAAHVALARRIAEASVTLVRDPQRQLPLRLGPGTSAAVMAPAPVDLTPAETSSFVHLGLADALRRRGTSVTEIVTPLDPTPAQVANLVRVARDAGVILVGTFDAVSHPGQVELARAVAAAGLPTAAIALRSPYDAALFPPSIAAVCTYGIQAPQMDALAAALVGDIPFAGELPVSLEAVP